MRYGRLALVTTLAAAWLAPAALAGPATTVQRTIQDCDGDQLLEYAPGEPHILWSQAGKEPAGCERARGDDERKADHEERWQLRPQDSVINFLQLTDFQAVDEESPARVEWLDATQRIPRLQPFSAAYRPQESTTTQIVEAMVRQVRDAVSPVTSRKLDLTILTGDNADSQQYNETRWFIDILDGRSTIDPNSGIPTAACPGTPGSVYDGVRDSGQTGVAPDGGYYEPDASTGARDDGDGYSPVRSENVAETPGSDVTVRDFPGLFERANSPFHAVGLDMPWYSAFGNHDALVQGNSPEAFAGPFGPGPAPGTTFETVDVPLHAVATGCVKVRQPGPAALATIGGLSQQIAALREGGVTQGEQDQIDTLDGQILALVGAAQTGPCDPATGCQSTIVPPDPRRCFLPKSEPAVTVPGTPCATGSWIAQHFRTTGTPVGHGFANRPPEAVANHDGYYSFSPRKGLRFVVLDTITDECGTIVCSEGTIDDTQFQWLGREIVAAADAGQYVLVFSHHTLRTIRFASTDATEHPLHTGERVDRRNPANPTGVSEGPTLEELYCQHPNVLAHVDGHEHANAIERHGCGSDEPPTPGANPYFWEIGTAAHIDWPQQSRMIELVKHRGKLWFVLTMLDHAGPPNPGGAPEQSDQGQAPSGPVGLASVGREIAYNDYQGDRSARGRRQDRNVILPTDRAPAH
jgi:3',5'-cyclic AMP phosphodiesterase CpdA